MRIKTDIDFGFLNVNPYMREVIKLVKVCELVDSDEFLLIQNDAVDELIVFLIEKLNITFVYTDNNRSMYLLVDGVHKVKRLVANKDDNIVRIGLFRTFLKMFAKKYSVSEVVMEYLRQRYANEIELLEKEHNCEFVLHKDNGGNFLFYQPKTYGGYNLNSFLYKVRGDKLKEMRRICNLKALSV